MSKSTASLPGFSSTLAVNFESSSDNHPGTVFCPTDSLIMDNSFEFSFIKAKMGWTRFWVKDVEYTVDNNKSSIYVFLEGGILNRYRELAVEKALFKGQISHRDEYEKFDFEIDDLILGRNRELYG